MGLLWAWLAIFAVTLLAYLPALHGNFLWDDDAHVTKPELRSLHGLQRIWAEPGATQQYYPLLHSAFWIEHRLWGDSALGYHLVNILLHATAACLLAMLLKRIGLRGGWWAAALFALHPVAVESVAWITEQKNTLSLVCYFCAALAYLRFDERRSIQWYALATLCFFAALLSKSVTATLPAALLVVFWWRRGTLSWRRDAAPLAPWFALGIGMGLFTAWVERNFIGAEGADFALSFLQRTLLAGRVVAFYAGKLVWPQPLIFIYPRWTVDVTVAWQYLFPLGVALVLALLFLRKRRGLLAAALLFVGSLFPSLGFFNVYPFRFSFVADHFQYPASASILALVGLGLSWLGTRGPRWVAWAVGGAMLCVCGALTWRQCGVYRDRETLWRTTLAQNPDCWMAHDNLGRVLLEQGRISEAVPQLAEAVRLQPESPQMHSNYGVTLMELGRMAEAQAQFETCVRLKPDDPETQNNLGITLYAAGQTEPAIARFENAVRLYPGYADAHRNLGRVLARAGRTEQAIAHLREALRLKPANPDAHDDLADILMQTGQSEEAGNQYRAALQLRPDDAAAHLGLAALLSADGKWTEAMAEYQTVLRANPKNGDAAYGLGNAFIKLRRWNDALPPCEAAVRLQPKRVEAHLNLGAALFFSGRPDEAVRCFETALELSPDSVKAHYFLGNVRMAQGNKAEARAQYEAALRINPDYGPAKANLARLTGSN